MARKYGILIVVAVVAGLLAACGSTAPSTAPTQPKSSAPSSAPAQASSTSPSASAKSAAPAASPAPYAPLTYTGADRLQRLEAEAKKEGKLTWYTALAGEVVTALAEGFKKDYGIEVSLYRGGTANVVTKAVQEDQAGKNVADVLELTLTGVVQLQEMGLLQPYYTPAAKGLPKDFVFPASGDLIWGANESLSLIGFAHNTNMVPASGAPKKFEDLLNPALKGKMAISSTDTGIRWIGLVLKVLGDAQGREFLAKLKDQNVQIQSISGAALLDLIAQGQIAAGPAIYRDHTKQAQEKGAPVAWIPLDNIVVSSVGMMAIGKKAPNPNAAALAAEYVLSGNGAKILDRMGYPNAMSKLPFDLWVPEGGMTGEQYRQVFETWQGLFDQTFRK